jgi:hypothetical protein
MKILKAHCLKPYIPSPYDNNNNFMLYDYSYNGPEYVEISIKDYTDIPNFLNKLISSKPSIKFGKKTYLGKLSNLPRHKTKTYFEENKIHKTSRLDQSDTIVLNKEHLIKLLDVFSNKRTSYRRLKISKVYLVENESLKETIRKITKSHTNNLSKDDIPYGIFINDDNLNRVTPRLLNLLKNAPYNEAYIYNLYRENNLIDTIECVNYLLSNPHVNIIFDEDLLLNLNEDGIELDDEYLFTLDSMFESKSQDNINLALEMLANVNIEKHSLTIALFLNKHKNKFAWGTGLSMTNNASFKSIIKFFESHKINFYSDWRSFSTNLYKLHKDNPENLKIIQEFVHQNINLYLRECGSEYLQVGDLSLALSR